ncbi:unnamed protein product [Polarella glacialis]|uniref:Inner centromere protein ARK-binding domain-containing protein n=1 Tax=Polarella glacialis TaxID=89957 RepID=A0A813FSS5_POLGL|nr:unnamed protein product [Polarella glacialis]
MPMMQAAAEVPTGPEGSATELAGGPLKDLGNVSANCAELLFSPRKLPLSPTKGFGNPQKGCRSPTKGLEQWQVLRNLPLSPANPEDNYELSDQDCSEGDEAAEAQRRSKKHVPRWCENYLEVLQKQAGMDPDTIFGGRVPFAELNEIFTDDLYASVGKSRPKRARGSSGNWAKDPLRFDECSAYKRKLGQTKGWMADLENMPLANQGFLAGLAAGGRPLPTPARSGAAASSE